MLFRIRYLRIETPSLRAIDYHHVFPKNGILSLSNLKENRMKQDSFF